MKIFDNINWILVFIVIWAVLFGNALISRLLKLKGKPGGLVEPAKSALLFDESYASARSHRKSLGAAMRCIHVSVTLDAVFIRPHFPFSLIGPDADLVHEIPIQKITDCRIDPHVPFGVTLIFEQDSNLGKIDLDLKQPTGFTETVLTLKNEPSHQSHSI